MTEHPTWCLKAKDENKASEEVYGAVEAEVEAAGPALQSEPPGLVGQG